MQAFRFGNMKAEPKEGGAGAEVAVPGDFGRPPREASEGDAVLGVVGLGYVGLPLAIEAAKNGIRVVAFDVDEAVVDGVNNGRSHIRDVSSEDVARARGRGLLRATAAGAEDMGGCQTVAICVPTPLSKTHDPDLSHLIAATKTVSAVVSPGQLVIVESTTYPGMTCDMVRPVLEKSGLRTGDDFHLCFSPERVDPANDTWGIRNTPKLVGGVTPACTRAGVAFYSRFVKTVVPLSSSTVAEFTKLFENTFRMVNIGLVNEMALIADRLGLDIWEVVAAAATKPFGFMEFHPGPGLGGHCIPVDPQYLSWKMRTLDCPTRFIDLASEINQEMPAFVVGKIREAFNRAGKSMKTSRVLMIGVAYKRDVPDVRESPALRVIELLMQNGADVCYHDPYVPEWSIAKGRTLQSTPLSPSVLREIDAVVIVTDHTCIDYKRLVRFSPIVVDARNATRKEGALSGDVPASPWIVKGERDTGPKLVESQRGRLRMAT